MPRTEIAHPPELVCKFHARDKFIWWALPTYCPAPADGRPGKREQCVEAAQQALDQGESVLVDRTNVTPVSVAAFSCSAWSVGAFFQLRRLGLVLSIAVH